MMQQVSSPPQSSAPFPGDCRIVHCHPIVQAINHGNQAIMDHSLLLLHDCFHQVIGKKEDKDLLPLSEPLSHAPPATVQQPPRMNLDEIKIAIATESCPDEVRNHLTYNSETCICLMTLARSSASLMLRV